MLAVCCPRSALCEPYVGPMFAYVSRMWPQVGPMLALCWPKLALCWPFVGPILALCRPIMSTNFAELCSNTFNMSFFPFRGPPWTPKPRKTRGFLIAPRWISATPKATKHRKTRCFLTPRAKNTVNYVGSGTGEVTRTRSAAGAARHYNLRLPTEGLRQGHGSPWQWPAPGFKGYRPCRRPLLCGGAGCHARFSPSRSLCGMHPKQGNPSRIQAKG